MVKTQKKSGATFVDCKGGFPIKIETKLASLFHIAKLFLCYKIVKLYEIS